MKLCQYISIFLIRINLLHSFTNRSKLTRHETYISPTISIYIYLTHKHKVHPGLDQQFVNHTKCYPVYDLNSEL